MTAIHLSLNYTYISNDDKVSSRLISAESKVLLYHFAPELLTEMNDLASVAG